MIPRKLTQDENLAIDGTGIEKLKLIRDWTYNQFSCSHCGKCTRRCEVLSTPDLDIGKIAAAYDRIVSLPFDEQVQATLDLVASDYLLYNALRQCCFCGFCTAACRRHVLAPEKMRGWRELFMRANLMPPDASKLVMVDNEWHIFSAYRAIYGVAYPEFISLETAAQDDSIDVDTLLFPGCSLVSYAPDVVRKIGNWLSECGIKWALCDGCCGSPLMSAGLFDRAHALRVKYLDQMRRAGIKRMITICPGCTDEFHEEVPIDIEIVPLPEILLEESQKRLQATGDSGFDPLDLDSVTFFDSCHDRQDMRNALAIRDLLRTYVPNASQKEMEHNKRGTLCCGAGGAVASYDPQITDARAIRILDEAKDTGVSTLVSMCPTCTYTFAQTKLNNPAYEIQSLNYLEIIFGQRIDWDRVFAELNGMWSGEYGPWLNATFF